MYFGCFKKVSESVTHNVLYKELDDNGNLIKDGKEFIIQDGIVVTGINGNEAGILNENASGALIFYAKGAYHEADTFIIVNLLGDYVTYCECTDYVLSCALESYAESMKEEGRRLKLWSE